MSDKVDYQKELFSNRLSKKYKELRKWARKNRVSCYRVYDKDIPEIPLAVDLYEFLPEDVTSTIECARFMSEQNELYSRNDVNVEKSASERRYAVFFMYERPYEKVEEEEHLWLLSMKEAGAKVFGIDENHVIIKERKKQKGENQYEKNEAETSLKGIVQEQGQLFNIDLTSYLDTFLFFDHRPLRAFVREISGGKRVLNLFCYTGSFSVYAASGNAKFVESIDLSNTYISVAKNNLHLNGFDDSEKYVFTKQDVFKALDDKIEELNKTAEEDRKNLLFDLIILDPPTFSNSKMSDNMLDINRQWSILVNKCITLLNKKGILYFSTNSRRLSFDENYVSKASAGGYAVKCKDVSADTIPFDYKNTKCHRCWKIYISDEKSDVEDGYAEKSVEIKRKPEKSWNKSENNKGRRNDFSRKRMEKQGEFHKKISNENHSNTRKTDVSSDANIFRKNTGIKEYL